MCVNCHNCFLTISVSAANKTAALPDNERLRKNRVKSVSVRKSNGVTKKNSTGLTLVADAVLFSAHLSLKDGSSTPIADMPLENLVRTTESPEPLCVDWAAIDPTQSVITFDDTAAGYNAAHVFELVFEIDCQKC